MPLNDCAKLPAPPDPRRIGKAVRRWALFLDVDGTVVELAPTPQAVQLSGRMRDILTRLGPRIEMALALVSGRTIADLDRIFAPLVLPAAGLHGLEQRGADGRVRYPGEAYALDHLRRPLADFAAEHPGVLLEDKGRALALHYRNAPDAEAPARALIERLIEGESEHLHLLAGKRVLEVKPAHADKGSAVKAFLDEPPFQGRLPVYLGDDVTDEDAFRVVNRLDGLSIRVGPGAGEARYGLSDVTAVGDWLAALAEALPHTARRSA